MAQEEHDPGRLPEDREPFPAKGPAGERELSDEQLEKQAVAKQEANDALEDGHLQKAMEKLSDAIAIGNVSAMLYAKRADVLLRLRRPCACIEDCSSAIEINPDSAKAYRIRGKAFRKIGKWEEAHKDISLSQQLDYDDDLVDMQKFVADKVKEMASKQARTSFSLHEAWAQADESRAHAQPAPQASNQEEEVDEEEEEEEEELFEDEDEEPEQRNQRPPEAMAGPPQSHSPLQNHSREMATQMSEDEGDEFEDEQEQPQHQQTEVGERDQTEPEEDDPERLPEDPRPYPTKGPEGHVELSDEKLEKQEKARQSAADAIEDGDFPKALDRATLAILIGNASAAMYARRAEILLKLKRPCACIADCDAAIEINPDSAKAYRIRGKAQRRLGRWEEAHNDISLSQKIDFDDNMVDMQKLVAEKRNCIIEKKNEERLEKEYRVEENLLRRRKAHEERTADEEKAAAEADAQVKHDRSFAGRCGWCARRFRGEPEGPADDDSGETAADAAGADASEAADLD